MVSMVSKEQLTALFVCPSCGGELQSAGDVLSCLKCPSEGQFLAENQVDFLGADSGNARAILDWPTSDLAEVESALVAIQRGKAIGPEAQNRLAGLGLVGPDGKLTTLGLMAAYNSAELSWQSNYDPLEGLVPAPELNPETRVLDLGGGSGQTIRRLFPELKGTVLVVDAFLDALAYGSKLFSGCGLNALFCCGSAHALPLRDDYFDFIICRGVISYTYQKQALKEALRVLRPGGLMFLRVESINWDLKALTHPKRLLRYLFDLRSFGWGVLLNVTGYQPMPGGWLKGPRAYVSPRRFRQNVESNGGEVLRYESSRHGPQFRGRGTQDIVLCRKRTSPAGPVQAPTSS